MLCILIFAGFIIYLVGVVHKLETVIIQHRTATRQDPCWQNDVDLWKNLDDNDYEWPHGSYETKKAMRDGCRAYIDGCFDKC